jgi:hypothetical protein
MRTAILALTGAIVIAAAPALAQGVSNEAPGQQPKGTHNSPGASYYAPGQEKNRDAKNPNPELPGASGYAPGHSTTGFGIKNDREDRPMKSK